MSMPAGKYYIGDLCYVMSCEEWTEACHLFFANRDDRGCNEGEFVFADGRRFACYNTKHGDGTYTSTFPSKINTIGVDSGSVGCILVSDITSNLSEAELSAHGIIHSWDSSFNTWNKDGEIIFGSESVYTNEDPYDCIWDTSEEESDDAIDEDDDYQW